MEDQDYIDRNLELYDDLLNNSSQQQKDVMLKVYNLLPTEKHKEYYNKIRKLQQDQLDVLEQSKRLSASRLQASSKKDNSKQSAVVSAAKSRYAQIDETINPTMYSDECYSDFAILNAIPCPKLWHEGMTHGEYLKIVKQRQKFQQEMIKHSQSLLEIMNENP